MLSSLEAVVYFVNHEDSAHPSGYILLAPTSSHPTPEGYTREFARSLPEIDRLQATLVAQERAEWERDLAADESLMAARRSDVRDRLYARMVSSATSAYEREFIELYLQLREEKRARHRQRFLERSAFLTAREMDTPRGRQVYEERVNVERIG